MPPVYVDWFLFCFPQITYAKTQFFSWLRPFQTKLLSVNQVNNQRHQYHPLTIQYYFDSEDDYAQVVKTSVTVTNSSFQKYTHLDDHTRQTTDTPGFKPFTMLLFFQTIGSAKRICCQGCFRKTCILHTHCMLLLENKKQNSGINYRATVFLLSPRSHAKIQTIWTHKKKTA